MFKYGLEREALGKLDIVTREEFEVQKAVLAKTRSKLEVLEKQLTEIEQNLTLTSQSYRNRVAGIAQVQFCL